MKTIKQAANYYAGITDDKHHNEAIIYSPNDIANTFTAGVEFAQRWYPVSDSLPNKETSDFILFKNQHSSYCFKPSSLEMNIKDWVKLNGITHWRPVTIK